MRMDKTGREATAKNVFICLVKRDNTLNENKKKHDGSDPSHDHAWLSHEQNTDEKY